MKVGWRHGVTGIDNADSENTSVFYKDGRDEKERIKKQKERLNNTRLECKFLIAVLTLFLHSEMKLFFGTSSQLPISSDEFKRSSSLLQKCPETLVDLSD